MPLTTSDINRLPQLPATAAPTLPMSILAGLNTGVSDPLALIDVRRNRGGGVFDPRYINILDPDHDVVRNGNVVRRRLMVFGPEKEGFRTTVNGALAGGESSPVLITALGIAAGVAMNVAGIAFSVLSTAIEMQRVNQPVRVRQGDAIDKIEVLGRRGGQVMHWETIVLVDPFRVQASHTPQQWVIHGVLSEVRL